MNGGTTLDCFEDFIHRLQSFPDFFEKRKKFAVILGVEDATIRRWMVGSAVPHGRSLISLRCYLDHLGYQVNELIKLPEVLREASKLIAFRIITLDELTKSAEFGQYPDIVLAVLRGVRGVSQARIDRFEQLVIAHRNELTEAIKATPRIIDLGSSSAHEHDVGVAAESPAEEARPNDSRKIEKRLSRYSKAELFRGLVINLLDCAGYYFQSSIPESEREKMRDIVGQDNIFELKNMLSRLCSSKAFSNR